MNDARAVNRRHVGERYELVDGRVFVVEPDTDVCGVALREVGGTVEFVVRGSVSAGEPVAALWERRWTVAHGQPVAVWLPTDFTLHDLEPTL